HGQAEQEQRNEQQGTALHVQRALGQITEHFTQYAAGRTGQPGGGVEMNVRQRCACEHQKHQTDQAPGEQPAAPLPRLMPVTEHLIRLDAE
nr:hypothetical protein [Tanacetum cinerariifolium]